MRFDTALKNWGQFDASMKPLLDPRKCDFFTLFSRLFFFFCSYVINPICAPQAKTFLYYCPPLKWDSLYIYLSYCCCDRLKKKFGIFRCLYVLLISSWLYIISSIVAIGTKKIFDFLAICFLCVSCHFPAYLYVSKLPQNLLMWLLS